VGKSYNRPHRSVYQVVVVSWRFSALRLIGVTGVGVFSWTIVCSIAVLLFLLRYLSHTPVPSTGNSTKGVSMAKKLTARVRMLLNSTIETVWTNGADSVAGVCLPKCIGSGMKIQSSRTRFTG